MLTDEDKKSINEILEQEDHMEDKSFQVTIQWGFSKNGIQVSENHTGRFDTQEEENIYRLHALGLVPQTQAFPDDSGPVATPPQNTVQSAPVCGVHGIPMTLKPAGVSRAGKPYPAFWSCSQKNPDGTYCSYKPK
jgi:hypothetical protein